MSFTQANRREVESLVSKLTTVGDNLGKVKRDVRMVRLLNPQWPSEMTGKLSALEAWLSGHLALLAGEELAIIELLNELAPQE